MGVGVVAGTWGGVGGKIVICVCPCMAGGGTWATAATACGEAF